MRPLWGALRQLSLGEVLQVDFWIGLAGGVGGLVLGLKYPDKLVGAVGITAGVVGAVIGAVIAATAIQTAFLDQAFLRKLRAIGRDPVTYLTPFLFTAAIGVFALLGLLVLSVMSPTATTWVLAVLGTLVGFFSSWPSRVCSRAWRRSFSSLVCVRMLSTCQTISTSSRSAGRSSPSSPVGSIVSS